MRTRFLAMPVLVSLLVGFSVFGSWESVALDERVEGVDLIVVGRLSDIVERDFALTYARSDLTTHYDRGLIRDPKVLKGDPAANSRVRVAFHSKGQKDHPFRHMHTSHSANDEGIWFLTRDRVLTGFHFALGPDNPLPLDLEEEVVQMLKDAEAN